MAKNHENLNNSKNIHYQIMKFGTDVGHDKIQLFAKFQSYTSNGGYFTDQNQNSRFGL